MPRHHATAFFCLLFAAFAGLIIGMGGRLVAPSGEIKPAFVYPSLRETIRALKMRQKKHRGARVKQGGHR